MSMDSLSLVIHFRYQVTMKTFHSCLYLLLVMFLLLQSMSLDVTSAQKKKLKKSKLAVCRYDRAGSDSPCNTTTNMKVITLQLKKGNLSTCKSTKLITKPCHENSIAKKRKVKGCRYERNGSDWTECDPVTHLMSKVMKLKEGSSSQCPSSHVKTKACGSSTSKKGPQRSRKVCHYVKGEWGPCDLVTNLEQRSLTPRKSDPVQCQASVESRPCQRRTEELVAAKSNKCRYSLGEWSTCDLRSNTMTQWMTLKSGDPNVCQRSKKLTKKCRLACKFRRGEWSDCDEHTLLMTRVDTLVKGSSKECDLTREITKKCKRVCKYTIGEWGQCDPVTNHRTRVKTLVSGSNFKKCLPEEIVTKPCTKKDGEERCFFGSWGEFGPCTNGVMTKHRPVLQGGLECERKGAITKACDRAS